MVADRYKRQTAASRARQGRSGQSILEFLLMLPLMLALTVIMIRSNTVIQMSIVNQQYGRAHALWLAFNSPVYPERRFWGTEFVDKKTNRMVTGVSENAAKSDGKGYEPEASNYRIARMKSKQGSRQAQSEPPETGIVFVRNNVALCTHSIVMKGADGYPRVNHSNLSETGANPGSFVFCRSDVNE